MAVERLDPATAAEALLDTIDVEPIPESIVAPEALAGLVRRAASFVCPITPRRLSEFVTRTIIGLPNIGADCSSLVDQTIESLIAIGDLVELSVADEPEGPKRRVLYLGTPSYVRRETRGCFVFGVRPDGEPLIADDANVHLVHNAHIRQLTSVDPSGIEDALQLNGLRRLRIEQWLRVPRPLPAVELLADYDARLSARGPAGDIPDLRILDPALPVNYYSGRWRGPRRADSGSFVARRPQEFGSDIWCYATLSDGQVERILDLPVGDPVARGADEALRLQAAIDEQCGHPQTVRVGDADAVSARIDFFGPVPTWVQRRLDVIASEAPRSRGALFSCVVPRTELDEELTFLRELMWFVVALE